MSSSEDNKNNKNDEHPNVIIGIDLGTTYSCLAAYDEKTKKIEVISSDSGRTMPSWVSFTSSGKTVGQVAKKQISSNPTNTIYDVKRILGRSYKDDIVQEDIKHLPYKVIEGKHGEPKIQVTWHEGKVKELVPEEISSMILSELRLTAEKYFGFPITDAVITVPAHFNNQQRQATKDAGRIAGLNVKRIINEPTAAALAYGLHDNDNSNSNKSTDNKDDNKDNTTENNKKENIIIFDLGGGTFDVTCLSMINGVLEVKATGGDTHLGGEDFDNTIVNWCLDEISKKYTQEISNKVKNSSRSLSRLRRSIEICKKNLSTTISTDIEVDSLLEEIGDFSLTLTRTKFEELNSILFTRCLNTVKDVLLDANVTEDEVTDIVLVGGSTRVPYLQKSLYEMFNKRIELCKSIHPDEAVAVGAAVQGRILATGGVGGGKDELLSDISTDLLLLDVTPLSLGIELEGRLMSTLIKRNTAIPCKKTRTYTTVEDWQSSIDVVVYEGERPSIDANNKLGSFVIDGIQKARAGEPKVDVTFSLDANGILNVSAKDQVTGSEANATIKADEGRLSPEDVQRMIDDAEKYRNHDVELSKKTSYKNALEECIYTAQSKANDDPSGTYDDNDIKQLEDLMDWLELDSDMSTLDEMISRGNILEEKFGIKVQV